MNSAQESTPAVALAGITKRYAGVAVLKDVAFEAHAGEVHALLGENGAGKSTLSKIIAGVTTPDEGTLSIGGEQVTLRGPSDALARGIAMVYQETSLIPTMTVAQNIQLGREGAYNAPRRINAQAANILQSMAFHVDAATTVASLGSAKRQMVEIARALHIDARVIIFDEPTASLTPEEKVQLFDVIDALRRAGKVIVFISHALEESLTIADRITVLRDGEVRYSGPSAGLQRDDLVRLMVGRAVEYRTRRAASRPESPRKSLQVQNVTMGQQVKNMSFTVYAGEITGIAGLVGAGRSEIAHVVAGICKRNRIDGGRVLVNGRPVRYRVPRQAMKDGIAYVTEDRKIDGFFETMTAEENVAVGWLARHGGWWSRHRAKQQARRLLESFDVRGDVTQPVISFSGGNQQKVVIAKSVVQEPEILIFDEPTRGVDVGAIESIHEQLRALADAGKAVVLISSYLPEVRALADRILVARSGRIVAEFDPDDVDEEQIMFAAVH